MLLLMFIAQDVPLLRVDPSPVVPQCEVAEPEDEGEVVVCGRIDRSPYRLKEITPLAHVSAIPRAVFRLSERSDMSVDTEARELLPGIVSNRSMIRYKLRF